MATSNNDKKISAISLSAKKSIIPEAEERLNRSRGWVNWGVKNDYPYFLIDLYDGSAWNQGLIKSKSYYIAGGGIEEENKKDISIFLKNEPSDFGMDEIMEGCAFDLELFGGVTVVGTWNRSGTRVVFWEYIDLESIREDESGEFYHVSEDWSESRQTPEKTGYHTIQALNMNDKSGRFLIYYKEPSKKNRKQKGVYPKPGYMGGLKSIQTDVDITEFHLNEINQGFQAGTIINLANGIPETEEQAREQTKKIKSKVTGPENAGEVLVTFSDGTDNAPSILRLVGDDLDKRYNLTEKSVQQNILVSHSITSPILHGIRTEGLSIGTGAEMEVAYEIFKNTYISTKQRRLEWVLNLMSDLSNNDFELKLAPAKILSEGVVVPPSNSFQINFEGKKKKYNSDESEEINTDEEALLELFSTVGVNKSDSNIYLSKSIPGDVDNAIVMTLEEDNFKNFFDVVGDLKIVLSDFDQQVLKLFSEGNEAQSIARATGKTLEDVVVSLEKMKALNLIDGTVTDLANDVIQELPVNVTDFEIRYSYEVRTGVGAEIIPGTRDFCRTLIGLDRLYSRLEIQQITDSVDRDVWRYRGGWWNDSGTNKPFCRHEWVQNLVKK